MQEFAQELIDKIIDAVVAIQKYRGNDLVACSRVCRRWLPRSRKHLFDRINLSSADLARFLDLSPHLLSLVHLLAIWVTDDKPFSDASAAQLEKCSALTDLYIHTPDMGPIERLKFQRWLEIHIPRFGAACPALTRFDLVFKTEIDLGVVRTILSGLPHLTHLRLDGGKYNGIASMDDEPVAPAETLPRHLHTLDLMLPEGACALFEWLLSHHAPPAFTFITLRGYAYGAPTTPILNYFARFGAGIEALTIGFWVDADCSRETASFAEQTRRFQAHALALTPGLKHLTLGGHDPADIPGALAPLASRCLTTLTMQLPCKTPVHKVGGAEWLKIDKTVTTQRFASLRYLVLRYSWDGISLLSQINLKEMMPQVSARGILH